jgi:hypothetical protein
MSLKPVTEHYPNIHQFSIGQPADAGVVPKTDATVGVVKLDAIAQRQMLTALVENFGQDAFVFGVSTSSNNDYSDPPGSEDAYTPVDFSAQGTGANASGTVTIDPLNVEDGDNVTMSDGSTGVTFEFEAGDAPATGSVTLDINPSDQDAITISDGATALQFEFESGGGITGDVSVTIGIDEDATAANLITAINGAAINVTAAPGATANSVTVTNDADGAAGNVPITVDTEGTPDTFTVAGMSGGGDAGITGGSVSVARGADADASAANLITVINAHAVEIQATEGASPNIVVVTNTIQGADGNQAMTESTGGARIGVAGLSGGADDTTQELSVVPGARISVLIPASATREQFLLFSANPPNTAFGRCTLAYHHGVVERRERTGTP